MAEFLSPMWIEDNFWSLFFICIMLFFYYFYKKRPLDKPRRKAIQGFGGNKTFENKTIEEIDLFLNENMDFSDVDYTSKELSTEIWCHVNNISPKKYEREQKMK